MMETNHEPPPSAAGDVQMWSNLLGQLLQVAAQAEAQTVDNGQPPGGATLPDHFLMPRTFFCAPPCLDIASLSADVAFLGVPYDQGTSGRAGARFGPDAIRDARVYRYGRWTDGAVAHGYYDVERDAEFLTGVTMADCGDIPCIPAEAEQTADKVTRTVWRILERGALPVVVGGDHSITGAVVRGFDRFSALDLVHFDAHLDFAEHFLGNKWGHGSAIRRCAELPFVRNITQIGIRTTTRGSVLEARARGNRIVTAEAVHRAGPAAAVAGVSPSAAVYVTIDIDVLDPVFAPATGTPSPGGLTFLQLREALRELAARVPIVGIDLVEVAPPYDHAGVTALTASQLLLDLLGSVFAARAAAAAPAASSVTGGVA